MKNIGQILRQDLPQEQLQKAQKAFSNDNQVYDEYGNQVYDEYGNIIA